MEAIEQPLMEEPAERGGVLPVPWITLAVLVLSAVCTWLWLAYPDQAGGWLVATDVELWRGEKLWGLITSLFVHVNAMHLAFNGYWLWHLGRVIEQEVRPASYVTLILVTTLLGSLAEFAVSGQTGVGMSGMVYGLFGYMLITRGSRAAFQRVLKPGIIRLLLGWLVLCFALTYSRTMAVANFAHLGGLAAGVLCGLATGGRRSGRAAVSVLCVLIFGFGVALLWAPWHDNWHFVRAVRLWEKNDMPNALVALEYYHQRQPRNAWVATMAAQLRVQQKDYAAAKQILATTQHWTDDAVVANSLAWLLATCPEDKLRDGPRAVELATQACEFTEWKNASIIDTLAAAYAECGDFDAALKWSGKAVELSTGDERELLQKNNQTFQSKQPLRRP